MPAVALSRKDLVQLVLITVVWGLNWPVMKAGVQDFAPLTFRLLSMVGGLAVLGITARVRGYSLRVPREHWREVVLLGMTNMVLWYVLSIWGVKLLSSGRAAILGYTMPVWAALVGWLFWRDGLSPRLAAGVLAAVAAVALLLGGELGAIAGRPLGTLLMLGAAVCWAVGTQWMRRRRVDVPIVVLSFWMMALSVVLCGAIAWLVERPQWVRWPNGVEWGAVLFNVVLVFGFVQLLWFRLASILPPVASGLSIMLIPVVGLFSGMALLGERPTWHDWAALGCVLVSIGAALLPARSVAARHEG
jgi:drug/metabolite transporter (DMT)-like permease